MCIAKSNIGHHTALGADFSSPGIWDSLLRDPIAKSIIDYHTALGAEVSSRGMWDNLVSNPTAVYIVLVVGLLSLSLLLVFLIEYFRSHLVVEDCESAYEQQQDEEQGAQPWSLTLTDDGTLIDNASGRPVRRHYGTFYIDNGVWYDADGTELNYNQWVEAVYDPLD